MHISTAYCAVYVVLVPDLAARSLNVIPHVLVCW